jgi:O-methyltransferase
VIVFDDYGFVGSEGVTKFVNEFIEINKNLIFLHNLNGHGIIIKK